jgi:transmembrane sensor
MKNLIAKYINSVCTPEEFEKFSDLILRKEDDDLFPLIIKPVWDQFMQQESTRPSNNDLLRKINLTIEEMEKRIIRRKLTLNTWGLRIAAILLIGLVLTNLFFLRRASVKDSFITEQTVSIPFGARTSFLLPDGSKVWLNSGSTLSYGNNFGNIRSVSLEGEAYFEVIEK